MITVQQFACAAYQRPAYKLCNHRHHRTATSIVNCYQLNKANIDRIPIHGNECTIKHCQKHNGPRLDFEYDKGNIFVADILESEIEKKYLISLFSNIHNFISML